MRQVFVATATVGLCVFLALAIAACGSDSNGTSTPTPSRFSIGTAVPTGAASPPGGEATPPASGGGNDTLLYAEFGEAEDTLRLVDLDSPEAPRSIGAVSHAPYWGINASLSPDGSRLGYVVLPAAAPDPERGADSDGEIWVLPLNGSGGRLVTTGANVRFAPMWSPDGRYLLFATFERASNALAVQSVNVEDGTTSALAGMEGAQSVLLLGFSPDGRFYLAQTKEGGTDVLAMRVPGGTLETRVSIPGLSARQGEVSPDGNQVSLVGADSAGGWGVWMVTISDGAVKHLQPSGLGTDREIFSAVWRPAGQMVSLGTAPQVAESGVLNLDLSSGNAERLPGPQPGFDVPLAWSSAGNALAVQEFTEYPVRLRPQLRVIAADGKRLPVAESVEATFIGWLSP